MNNEEHLLSFLDLLDLDEDLINNRLKSLMVKNNLSNKQLTSVIQLLQYKMLINTQEGTECENNEEYDFIIKLLYNLNNDNIDLIHKIIKIVLSLNTSTIVSKAEHLLQQILVSIDLQIRAQNHSQNNTEEPGALIYLKICDSILEAVIKNNEKLLLTYMATPLEYITDSKDEKLRIYFLTNTVPKFFQGIEGYNILDKIWEHVKNRNNMDKIENTLKILCCLSDYYLPLSKDGSNITSEMINLDNFWDLLLIGMNSDIPAVRKLSVYLTKRAIDCKTETQPSLNWDPFFILIDSLEEKQANIVLPSLHLFETISIEPSWIKTAFRIGLKHDNLQVRLKCIEYRFKCHITVTDEAEARVILEALNDINIFDHRKEYENLEQNFCQFLNDHQSFIEIFKAIPNIKWSPVPFYHITTSFSKCKVFKLDEYQISRDEVIETIIKIIKVPCNNLIIKRGIEKNIVKFLENSYTSIGMEGLLTVICKAESKNYLKVTNGSTMDHPFANLVKQLKISKELKYNILDNIILRSYYNLDITMLLLKYHYDVDIFPKVIDKKITVLQELMKNKDYQINNDLEFIIILITLYNSTDSDLANIKNVIHTKTNILVQLICCLFKSKHLNLQDITSLLKKVKTFDITDKESVFQLYSISKTNFTENMPLDKVILAMFVIKLLLSDVNYNILKEEHDIQEIIDFKSYFQVISSFKSVGGKNESFGRYNNIFNETSCELLNLFIDRNDVKSCVNEIITFIENALECGGYGCLEWILKIDNKIIKNLIPEKSFNTQQFLNRLWKEIEELKSNSQYNICMKLFINLILNELILGTSKYNNIVISYYTKIYELGSLKSYPLFYLTKQLKAYHVLKYSHLIYSFSDMLLFSPVLRKDERITEDLSLRILQNQHVNSEDISFNFKIQYNTSSILCGLPCSDVNHIDTLELIVKYITKKVDTTFKNKKRYHGNSTLHKMLQITLQHLLIIVIKDGSVMDGVVKWCFEVLNKLPHQPSVRVCLEWIISLFFYSRKITIEETLRTLQTNNVPLPSQFYIIYWILKHKIIHNIHTDEEFNYILEFFLSHTMGQLFNIRLLSQYFATTLYKLLNKSITKFDYTIRIIEKTFIDGNTDKTFKKLQNDYFANEFDLVANLSPYFIYYSLPKLCDFNVRDHLIKVNIRKSVTYDMTRSLEENNRRNDFIEEWLSCKKNDEQLFEIDDLFDFNVTSEVLEEESMHEGSLQKKYIPWKNMGLDHDVDKKEESRSGLIVVASLVDKIPNLGGMARTCEVFGVKSYVLDSLRHLQDKQFQSLSVSAERWIDEEEVRPGPQLKQYLHDKKQEGYCIVAAEQTSTSCSLQSFKFPKKTVLLLGHEKDGVPSDLLSLMEHCVEIPQCGRVRSLNVHVSAALFAWQYATQHLLHETR